LGLLEIQRPFKKEEKKVFLDGGSILVAFLSNRGGEKKGAEGRCNLKVTRITRCKCYKYPSRTGHGVSKDIIFIQGNTEVKEAGVL